MKLAFRREAAKRVDMMPETQFCVKSLSSATGKRSGSQDSIPILLNLGAST